MRRGLVALIGLLASLSITACATQSASPTRQVAPTHTVAQMATATPNVTSLATSSPLPPSPSALPTTPIPTTTPAPPTPVIPAGLYITSLDIVPDPPTRGSELEFYATFANATSSAQNFRWIVYIYRTDNPVTSFGQATATASSIQLGAHTQKSLGYWKLPLGGPCENYNARVAWLDQNNQSTPFLRPDGKAFEKPFMICAPADLPTTTPVPPSPATPIPTPGQGLFITDLRTDPSPPTRGADLIFHPTFLNTAGTVQNYRWLVYVHKLDNPVHSYGETTALRTTFPVGASEQRSLGSWKLPLGGPCEDFVAG